MGHNKAQQADPGAAIPSLAFKSASIHSYCARMCSSLNRCGQKKTSAGAGAAAALLNIPSQQGTACLPAGSNTHGLPLRCQAHRQLAWPRRTPALSRAAQSAGELPTRPPVALSSCRPAPLAAQSLSCASLMRPTCVVHQHMQGPHIKRVEEVLVPALGHGKHRAAGVMGAAQRWSAAAKRNGPAWLAAQHSGFVSAAAPGGCKKAGTTRTSTREAKPISWHTALEGHECS